MLMMMFITIFAGVYRRKMMRKRDNLVTIYAGLDLFPEQAGAACVTIAQSLSGLGIER
jgi:hypothetical protein